MRRKTSRGAGADLELFWTADLIEEDDIELGAAG